MFFHWNIVAYLLVPPLRSRVEDIPLFVQIFLQAAGERFGRHIESAEPELIRKFQNFDWPGNVRELKNTIDRLVILYQGPVLRAAWWDPPEKSAASVPSFAESSPLHGQHRPGSPQPLFADRNQKLQLAKKLLKESGDNLTWVAAQLGVNSSTLFRWRKAGKV